MGFPDSAMRAGPTARAPTSTNAFDIPSKLPTTASPVSVHASPAWDAVRARVATMSADERKLAARQAEILTVAGQGLAARPYAERRAILSHMAPHLSALGVGGDQVGGFDPTDRNLAQAIGEAVILKSMLGASDSSGAPGETQAAQSE